MCCKSEPNPDEGGQEAKILHILWTSFMDGSFARSLQQVGAERRRLLPVRPMSRVEQDRRDLLPWGQNFNLSQSASSPAGFLELLSLSEGEKGNESPLRSAEKRDTALQSPLRQIFFKSRST